MIAPKFTPGPWGWTTSGPGKYPETALFGNPSEPMHEVDGKAVTCADLRHPGFHCGPIVLVCMKDNGLPKGESNAPNAADKALIAAAPDLYEALRDAYLHIVFDEEGDLDRDQFDALVQRMKAAITRVEAA